MLGCGPKALLQRQDDVPRRSRELLAEAQRLYADGVVYNMRGQWTSARDAFDAALRIISQIDLEGDPTISDEVDALLREIAYDYRFTLSQAETLTVESAPVVLSLALSEKPFSELTQKRLKKLIEELPAKVSEKRFDFPIVWNERVKEKIVFFQTEAHKPFARWLGRSTRYLPMIRRIFAEEGLPQDLAYLPLIESGFNPNAYSWAHAVGIWQFIKGTARLYGLDVNWWVDERRDPEKSTRAAAKYLKKLYSIFGDWHLALAAYNCGEGRILRAIKKQKTQNYWELDLPTQTENYVPLFIAALIIAKDPQKYGFDDVIYEAPLDYDVVWVDEVVDLRLAARCAETSPEEIKLLNPELVRGCTPPKAKRYPLKVPKGKGAAFVENYRKVPDSEKTAWYRHRVKRGESLWTIARRYGTSVQALIDANSIKNPRALRPGAYLLVPIDRTKAQRIAAKEARRKSGKYVVKKGDTIIGIAKKLGVSAKKLMEANGLTAKSVIRPGQVLRVPGETTTVYHIVKKGETLSEIASRYGVKVSDLVRWNGLKSSTIRVGQRLRVELSEEPLESRELVHVVRRGESLWSIARRYGVTVSDIKRWNNLRSDRLSPGQRLVLKGSGGTLAKRTTKRKGKKLAHTVRRGESLWSIARRYGVTISDIKRWNGLKSDVLRPGQKLVIYARAKGAKTVVHTVRRGETLWQIARKYGTSADAIMKYNNLTDPTKLRPGDRLTILLQ